MRFLTLRSVFLAIGLVLATMGVAILGVGAGGEHSCCNALHPDCSGIVAVYSPESGFFFGYADLTGNPAYRCQDYANPVGCTESFEFCYTSPSMKLYSDPACDEEHFLISLPDVWFKNYICTYDPCD